MPSLPDALLQTELSRTRFLKAGGGLVVGFSLAGGAARPAPAASPPSPASVDAWIAIHANTTAELRTSQVDPGNGAATGLLAIMAEELGLSLAQVSHCTWDTSRLVNSGATLGSTAIQNAGPMVRAAAAYAYQAILALAAAQLGVDAGSLSVRNGVVSGGSKTVTYGQLVGGRLLGATIGVPQLDPGGGIAKPVADYTLVGTRFPRKTIPEKVVGTYTYVHNIRVPGMLHGRVVRPRGQAGYGSGAPILAVDERSVQHIPGVRVVRAGDFLGVVAPQEYDAIQAAAQLKVTWKDTPILPTTGNLWAAMRKQDSGGLAPARVTQSSGDVDAALASAARVVRQTYRYHGQGHMPIGPCCSVADVRADRATIFTNTQAIAGMTGAIAQLLGFADSAQVRAYWYEGSSSFGPGNRYVDTAKAAALMSKLVGAPVRVQLMRWDEHGWDAYGPAQLMDLRVGADQDGHLVAYDYTVLAQPSTSLDMTQELLGTLTYGQTVLQPNGSIYPMPGSTTPNPANTGSMYANNAGTGSVRTTGKTLPLFQGYFQNGPLRDPSGPQTAFASEQAIDELAYACGLDPIAFRRQNVADPRWLAVMNAAVAAARWQPKVAHSSRQKGDVVTGRGFAFGRHGSAAYAATVADVTVDKRTGKITVTHLYNALDAGLVVGVDLVENQMTGASVMGVSRALCEEVTFNESRVTSLDWVSYPILRFRDSPLVTNVIVQRPGEVPLGAGEPSTTPVAAAIANAFFDATGVRIREVPMTPARVRDTLKAAGAR
ncbi:MAG TPA: molybdopterin cofactor-binding domain-containing protein [Gaiellaceae bacterium]|nr:molybdopterin cofactor-binding domain-containing protein [Gaiellaceae bacterium]